MLYMTLREVSDISLASVQMCAINSYHNQDYWPTAPKIDVYEPKIDACWIEREHGDARGTAMLYITMCTFVQ